MAFDWRDYLTLATWLLDNPPEGVSLEAVRRTVVSRAYYAAFGHAIRYAAACLGFQARDDADDHGRLREHLKRSRRRRVADCLDVLRDWRNACDYDDEVAELERRATEASRQAEYVFAALPPPSTS
jgi:hypothetical protein